MDCCNQESKSSAELDAIRDFYGKTLPNTSGLQTAACCCNEEIPASHRRALKAIDEEIKNKSYGCGSPIPPAIEGCTVLDLGCGAGRDVYVAAQFAGPRGHVIGVDMTEELLNVGRKHQTTQANRFDMRQSNVDFRTGYIEDLAALGIADNSIDVVISNCSINLSCRKDHVFAEIFRVLKPGGELYFSDVFSRSRVPPAIQEDPLLRAECMGGAMYIEDFRRLVRGLGCLDYRVVSNRRIAIGNEEAEQKAGRIAFYSMTIRAFKLADLEDICEDYGQVAYYLGTISDHTSKFSLDDHHTFITGKPMLVCGNTAAMLLETRFAKHFRVIGDRSVHYGPFDCYRAATGGNSGGSSCC